MAGFKSKFRFKSVCISAIMDYRCLSHVVTPNKKLSSCGAIALRYLFTLLFIDLGVCFEFMVHITGLVKICEKHQINGANRQIC